MLARNGFHVHTRKKWKLLCSWSSQAGVPDIPVTRGEGLPVSDEWLILTELCFTQWWYQRDIFGRFLLIRYRKPNGLIMRGWWMWYFRGHASAVPRKSALSVSMSLLQSRGKTVWNFERLFSDSGTLQSALKIRLEYKIKVWMPSAERKKKSLRGIIRNLLWSSFHFPWESGGRKREFSSSTPISRTLSWIAKKKSGDGGTFPSIECFQPHTMQWLEKKEFLMTKALVEKGERHSVTR